jgi:hypothetical protein
MLVLLAATGVSTGVAASDKDLFPALPAPAELEARNDTEREAGVVILEHVTRFSGEIEVDASGGAKSWTLGRHRVRYLVLDAKGAEKLTRHSFFRTVVRGTEPFKIRGRTVTVEGEEFPLDPDKDARDLQEMSAQDQTRMVLRNLSAWGPRDRKNRATRTLVFPHVEPGAILDLAWSEKYEGLRELDWFELQEIFPVRKMRLKVRGLLLESSVGRAMFEGGPDVRVYWVPFFRGPIPPRAHATLDSEFNLDLNVTDLEPIPEEPFAPPRLRTNYVLVLRPESFALTKKKRMKEWRRNLFLFGPPDGSFSDESKMTISQELDPDRAMIRLDDLGLQVLPDWGSGEEVLEFYQSTLRREHKYFTRFLKRASGAEGEKEITAIAPASLSWRERTQRLYEHARSRVRPYLALDPAKTLSKLLQKGRGDSRDVSLYFSYLLSEAGIPARIILPLSRYTSAFQPAYGSWEPFVTGWKVEAAPPGKSPIYLSPGDPYANFNSLRYRYLGALAFRQPENVADAWPLMVIPADLPVSKTVQVAFTSPLVPDAESVELTLHTTSIGSDSAWFRERFDRTNPDEPSSKPDKRVRIVIKEWLHWWTGIEFKGNLPKIYPLRDVENQFSFEVSTPWSPEIQKVGDQLLVPALPQADLFRNHFRSETRRQPLWLRGGRYEVRFTWQLPEPYGLHETPPRAERSGPGGLSYMMEVFPEVKREGQQKAALTTRMILTLPHMLPASEYDGVKEFFESLEEAADTRLPLSKREEP